MPVVVAEMNGTVAG